MPVTFGRNCADGLSPPLSAGPVASDGPAVASMSFGPQLELEVELEPEPDDEVPPLLRPEPPRSFEPLLPPLLFDELDDPPRPDPLPLELPPPGSFPDGEDGVPPQ